MKIKGLERWDGGYVVFCGGEGRVSSMDGKSG
jgi:hypothetical protein